MSQFLRGIALIAAIVLNCGAAFGQTAAEQDTNALLSLYAQHNPTQMRLVETVFGAVTAGIVVVNVFEDATNEPLFCQPDIGLVGAQVVNMVRQEVLKDPSLGKLPISITVFKTLQRAFPCNKGAASAQEAPPLSADATMPACRAFLDGGGLRNDKLFAAAARCAGLVQGIAYGASAGAGVCYDPRTTVGDIVRVVVNYINDQPARLHENFNALALEAMRISFPCKH